MTDTTSTLPPYNPSPEPQAWGQPAADTRPFGPTPPPEHDPWLPPGQPPASAPTEEARRPRRGVSLLIAVALAAGLIGGGAGAVVTNSLDGSPTVTSSLSSTSSSNQSQPVSNAPAGSVEQVAAAVLPSVVSIEVRTANGGGEGSGIVLSSDGLILTNNHVVADAAAGGQLSVTLNSGKSVGATIVGRDPVTDLAVIRATGVSGLSPAKLGDSAALRPGQSVVAIGSPLGLQGTVTSGIVSALNRPVRTGSATGGAADQATVIDAIQTDAAINPGNSGGPLVNSAGQVVGINSAIASLGSSVGSQSGSIGLGFSIPINEARVVANQLIKSGSAVHAQLGVSVTDNSNTTQVSSTGATLAAVSPSGAAAKAGLQAGDVVTRVGDREVDSADALIAAVRSHRPGDKVTLVFQRGSATKTVTVTLGADSSAP
ncbi:MAG: putative serine protease PepD [Actinomycetota bacterium]|jgi:putative serine protease PepD|nr:putative serine protease PepD [Actinomycetota bacterium]MDQ1642659.1 putative serine protease PepD [Actinomycetota bacterium]